MGALAVSGPLTVPAVSKGNVMLARFIAFLLRRVAVNLPSAPVYLALSYIVHLKRLERILFQRIQYVCLAS